MLSTLKKVVPLSWRDRFRPQWKMLQEECKELTFPLQHNAARTKKSGLLAAANLEEAFRFAQTEFFISQHSGEILPALQYIQGIKPIVVGEVGTLNSGNAFLFLQAFSELRTLIAVDLHVRNRAKLRFYAPESATIHCIHGRSCAPQTTQQVRRALNGRKFDFMFIDGDHEYDGVRADLLQYGPLVRAGGLIGFHDIVPDHFVRYGRQGAAYAGDVHLLWSQLKARCRTHEFIVDPDQNGAGIGVMECDENMMPILAEVANLKKNDP
jgi:predicted O-methyltransferase YrrM